jgi:putative addiction module killer protein
MVDVKKSDVFLKWYKGLRDQRAKTRIYQRITRLKTGNRGDWGTVGESLFELRIHYGPGYRVYCKEKGRDIVILLGGGDKSTQQQDIDNAKRLAQEPEEEICE